MRLAMARPKARFTEADIKRAVKGALAAGVVAFSVTVTPEGSLQLTVAPEVSSGNAVATTPAQDDDDDLWAKKLMNE
jgi:hypothetical protein